MRDKARNGSAVRLPRWWVRLCMAVLVAAAGLALPGFTATPGASAAAGQASVQARAADPLFAYVVNATAGTVSAVDTATGAITATIPVGSHPRRAAVAPDGRHVYVTNNVSNNVSVIATATNTVTATIPVGTGPFGVAVAPDGRHVYVTNAVGGADSVSVIDTAAGTVTATVPVGRTPEGVAVTPDGRHVYVTNRVTHNVSVIATATNTVTATIPVGNVSPFGVAVTPDGRHVYVANNATRSVSVIATATNTVTATVPAGTFPSGVAVTPDGGHVYVTNRTTNNVTVIATATNTVTATVEVGNLPEGVAVTPDGRHVYVTNSALASNSVSVIDTATNTVTGTIPGFTSPRAIAIGTAPPPPPPPPEVFAGYADGYRFEPSAHPNPWQDSPGIVFEGCNYFSPSRCPADKNGDIYDAGALRLVNNTANEEVVTDASVTVGSCHFDPWPALKVRVPPGEDLILTQTGGPPPCPGPAGDYNFDSSQNNLSPTRCTVNDGVIPDFHVTVNGDPLTYEDTEQILNTGGKDPGDAACGSINETHNWAPMTAPCQVTTGGHTYDNLPAAVEAAPYAAAPGPTLSVTGTCRGTTLIFNKNLTITGHDGATLNGDRAGSVLLIHFGDVTLDTLTITNGSAGFGGGISNFGKVTLNGSTVTGNTATAEGGGIDNFGGTVTMGDGSTVTGNTAGDAGGGIYNLGGLLIGAVAPPAPNPNVFDNNAPLYPNIFP